MLTEEQKEARRHGIGGTDVAALLGLNPYMTPYELWMIKTGRLEEKPPLTESKLRIRHAHEITIANEYAQIHNCKLKRINKTLYHKKYPFMLCHLDRVVIGKRKIVECKSSSAYMQFQWGESGTNDAPLHYICQVYHQYAITGYDEADIAALINIDDTRYYPIPRDESLIKEIEERTEYFWRYHVQEDNPPDPSNRNDFNLMYPKNNGTLIDASDEALTLCKQLKEVKETIKKYEEEKVSIENSIISIIGENDGLKQGDQELISWRPDKNGKRSLRQKRA